VAWDHPVCQLWDHPEGPPPPAEETFGWASDADAEEAVGCIYSTERTPSAKPLDLLVFGTRDREVNRALVITGTIDVAAKRSVERHEVGVP
jgi:hypothetical protein